MMEFAPFYDVAGWAKSEYDFELELATCGFKKNVPSAFWGTEIKVDKVISEINVEDYDALAIPGGDHLYGFFEEAYKESFLELIRKFNEEKKSARQRLRRSPTHWEKRSPGRQKSHDIPPC